MEWTNVLASRSSRMKASEIRELLKLLDQPDIISFAGGIPDPALFPVSAFKDAFAETLTSQANAALQYSVSEGYKPCATGSRARWASWAFPATPATS